MSKHIQGYSMPLVNGSKQTNKQTTKQDKSTLRLSCLGIKRIKTLTETKQNVCMGKEGDKLEPQYTADRTGK